MKKLYPTAIIFAYWFTYVFISRWELPTIWQPIISRFDDLALVIALTFWTHLIYILFHQHGSVKKSILFGSSTALSILIAGEWWHYEFYRDYIHYASISYAGSWKELLKGIDGFTGRFLALGLLLGSLLVLNKLINHIDKLKITKKLLGGMTAFWFLLTILFIGITSHYYLKTSVKEWQTNKPIPLDYKSPILELARERLLGGYKRAVIKKEHWDALNNIYGMDKKNDLLRKINLKDPNKKQNVILIILESFRANETGQGSQESLTPNFDRISKMGFTPKNFYANSNQTIKGEIASLCGTHDFQVGTALSSYSGQVNMECLPELFSKAGFDTLWFHGGYDEFYNRNIFMPKIGFKNIIDRLTIEEDLYAEGKSHFIRHWGVEDPYVYEYALKKLETLNKPFFAEILSLSNHHPFVKIEKNWDIEKFPKQIHGDMRNMYRRYQHGVYYTDQALGKFWDSFSKSKLYENTVVVIMGDHGIWLFPDGMENDEAEGKVYETYVRLPMTMYIPHKSFSESVYTPLSQVDTAALISTYFLNDIPSTFQSKLNTSDVQILLSGNNLHKNFNNPVFASIGDGYFLRMGTTRCFPPLEQKSACSDYLFRCVKNPNTLQSDRHCQSWEGDILSGSTNISDSKYSTEAAERVMDYFKKSPLVYSAEKQKASQ